MIVSYFYKIYGNKQLENGRIFCDALLTKKNALKYAKRIINNLILWEFCNIKHGLLSYSKVLANNIY